MNNVIIHAQQPGKGGERTNPPCEFPSIAHISGVSGRHNVNPPIDPDGPNDDPLQIMDASRPFLPVYWNETEEEIVFDTRFYSFSGFFEATASGVGHMYFLMHTRPCAKCLQEKGQLTPTSGILKSNSGEFDLCWDCAHEFGVPA